MDFNKFNNATGAIKKTSSNRFFALGESSGEEDEEERATKPTAAKKTGCKKDDEERYSRKKLNRLQEENNKLKQQVAELREEMELQQARADKKYKDLQTVVEGQVWQSTIKKTKGAGKPKKAEPAAEANATDEAPFYRLERDGNRSKRRRLTEVTSVSGEPGPSKKETPPRGTVQAAFPRVETTKIPPVVLRKNEDWSKVQSVMTDKKISFKTAKLRRDGIAINPSTAEDHKKLIAALRDDKQEYHTYSLPEERPLRVVIRGIPQGIEEREIKEDLIKQGVAALTVQRMTDRRTKQPMPLVLVQVSKNQTNALDIFQVRRCCFLSVRTEIQRKQSDVTQCHRCQRFGHGQGRCTAQEKCVKCGGTHASRECGKPREAPARCANCGGPHPASYRGCPSFPKPRRNGNTRQENAMMTKARPKTQHYRPVTSTTSYADAAKPTREDEAEPEPHVETLEEQLKEVPEAQPEEQPEEPTEMEVTYQTDEEDNTQETHETPKDRKSEIAAELEEVSLSLEKILEKATQAQEAHRRSLEEVARLEELERLEKQDRRSKSKKNRQ